MKHTFYILFFLLPFSALAQPASSLDFSAGLGVSSYYGDINQEKTFYEPALAFSGFARYNFNNRYSLRANVMSTQLKAKDRDFENNYQQNRRTFFIRTILEIGLIGEVNFFPFQNPMEWGTRRHTIYALGGATYATSYASKKRNVTVPSLIMGVGYKRVLGKRFAVEFEWAFRKCLNDGLDGVIDPTNTGTTSRFFNNDWYNVLGVKLSYNFWQLGSTCRTFEKNTDL